MEELIKYFQTLEARLSALEQAQRANAEKLAANEERLSAIGDQINKVLSQQEDLQKKLSMLSGQQAAQSVVDIPVFPAVVNEPKMETPQPTYTPEPQPVYEQPAPQPMAQPAAPQPAPQPAAQPVAEAPQAAPTAVPNGNSTLYGKPVNDIRLAISLGDRFLYQRELFGQNAELMQRTLSELDNLGSFDEAMNYISQFNWDQESSTYQQFLITLHRRFG